MAEKDNDEYQFLDLESATPDSSSETELSEERDTSTPADLFAGKKNVKRNALMVILLVIILMVVYSVMNISSSNKSNMASIKPTPVSVIKKQQQTVATVAQPQLATPAISYDVNATANMNQKLSALELNQDSMRVELASTKNQMAVLTSNLNELTTKISDLNQSMVALTATMEAQSREMKQALVQKMPSPKCIGHRTVSRYSPHPPALKYYIQAVIPGRAWLIATNGATLTVREGTPIAGYGLVKLIDSAQGRVITGSGQVIRFSQEDS